MHEERAESLFPRLPEPAARQELFELFRPLAIHFAKKYSHRGVDQEDLVQVAYVGLLNAIDRFDPEYGTKFISFAAPTIAGELKRYFRDVGWGTGVPRRLKEVSVLSRRANEELTQRLGRSPTIDEVADEIGVSVEEVTEAASLGSAYRPDALDAPMGEGGFSLLDSLGNEDRHISHVVDIEALQPLLASRPARERRILHLRFYEEMTQRQIAEVMDMSQMHVSRLLSSSLEKLRTLIQA